MEAAPFPDDGSDPMPFRSPQDPPFVLRQLSLLPLSSCLLRSGIPFHHQYDPHIPGKFSVVPGGTAAAPSTWKDIAAFDLPPLSCPHRPAIHYLCHSLDLSCPSYHLHHILIPYVVSQSAAALRASQLLHTPPTPLFCAPIPACHPW